MITDPKTSPISLALSEQKPLEYVLYFDSIYQRYGKKVILENVDLRLRPGEFLSVVGPSGCGKSTLLRLITGQEQPKEAIRFEILGKPGGFPDARRGVVFQEYSLQPHLTLLRNVMLGLELQAKPWQIFSPSWRRRAKDMAVQYLTWMRLNDALDKYPGELSGGMRQRAAIAQTLVTLEPNKNPQILCMDEAFSALDAGTRQDLQVLMLELWKEYKITVVFVTHNLEEAVYLGTRLIVLSPNWDSDLGKNRIQGSRIVRDMALSPLAMKTEWKQSQRFVKIVAEVRETIMNPKYRQHVDDFNKDIFLHPDFLLTFVEGESKKNGCSGSRSWGSE